MFTRAICGPFVGRQLDCRRCQTQIDDVFTQPTLSDWATSSDLDICWRELTDAVVTIKKMKSQNEFITVSGDKQAEYRSCKHAFTAACSFENVLTIISCVPQNMCRCHVNKIHTRKKYYERDVRNFIKVYFNKLRVVTLTPEDI